MNDFKKDNNDNLEFEFYDSFSSKSNDRTEELLKPQSDAELLVTELMAELDAADNTSSPIPIEEDQATLDDTKLTDDFVLGKDFFIDTYETEKIIREEVAVEEPQKKAKKKPKKKSDRRKSCLVAVVWTMAIFVISIVAAIFVVRFGMDYLGIYAGNDAADEIQVYIKEGASAKEVAEILHENGIIDSVGFFRFYAKSGGYDDRFNGGLFTFTKQDTYSTIVDKLCDEGADVNEVTIVIPEGWTVDQIAVRLEENGVCTASQFKQAVNEATADKYNYKFMTGVKSQTDGVHYVLEGYLFPDTYRMFATGDKSGAEQAVKKMLSNMNNKLTDEMYKRAEELGYSMHDILTLASVVEMEASVASESDARKVAAVFWNRLNDWQVPKLQSDPTRFYKYNTKLYDTYEIVGLAPGAYCSPSLRSIEAVLWPDENCNSLYFVTDKNMKFYFNRSLSEHNNTIAKLKRNGLWAE